MPQNAQGHLQHQLQEVHLSDYITVIRRRRTTFLLAFGALFLGVALYTFASKPLYQASATLHLKPETGKGDLFSEMMFFDQSNRVDAELEILKSRSNAEKVVKLLHLDWQVAKKPKGLDVKLLEFTSTAKEPAYKVELTGADSYQVKDGDGALVGTGKAGVLMQGQGVTLLLGEVHGQAGDSFRLALLPFNDTVEGVRRGIKAVEVGKRTDIVQVSYMSTDPQEARNIVNTLVQVYLEQAIAFKTEEAGRTVSYVADQLRGLRDELDKSEKNLQAYKSASGVVQLDAEAGELVKKLSDAEKARAEVALDKKQAEFAIAALKDAKRKGVTYSPAVMRTDPVVAAMATRLVELEVQKRSLLTDYTENHPAVKTVQGQIDELQKKIMDTYETSLRNLSRQEGLMTQQLAGYEEGLRKLPEAERELARLTRLSHVNADIYTLLLKKHEEARIAKASTISNINIVDPAIVPDRPVKPKKLKNLLLGLLVGCMFGVGLAFFHDYMDDTIKDGEEAKRLLGWPLLGAIPHIATDEEDGKRSDANLISFQKPKSAAAEAFRSLRTGLHFAALRKQHKVIMVTSAFPGEGKTTAAANLAEILSQAGARVLLVGCDLRRPTLHEIFGFPRVPGLSEVLAGDSDLARALHHTGIQRLDYLSAGTIPPNPAELLGSEQMARLIGEQREGYDYIILDAPPVLAVSDTPILVPCCDLVVVLIEAGRVPAKAATRMREILSAVEAPVAGIVINDKSGRDGGYGYGYGYGYGDEEPAGKAKKPFWRRLLKF